MRPFVIECKVNFIEIDIRIKITRVVAVVIISGLLTMFRGARSKGTQFLVTKVYHGGIHSRTS